MDFIIDFVRSHYQVLIVFVIELVTLLLLIFKKKVKVLDYFEVVLLTLPDLINEAEAKYQDGSQKFAFVFNRCIEILCNLTHKSAAVIMDEYNALINEAIENLLSTPQKKER